MHQPHLSVIVVNYNGLRFIDGCISTIAHALREIPHEIIIVDNGSSDGSAEYIRGQFPHARLFVSEVNLGFTGGNNLGVQHARAEHVLLLNNDTECQADLTPLIDCMNETRVGVAGCALSYADGRIQHSVGYEHTPCRVVLSWLGSAQFGGWKPLKRLLETEDAYYKTEHRSIDWVSGACLLTRTDLWRRLGGLDERFFMYCEDVDYCRRVRAQGLDVIYTPRTRVLHYEGAGKAWIGQVALQRTARSYLIYMRKHFGAAAQFFVGSVLGAIFMSRSVAYKVRLARSSRDNVTAEKCSAYWSVGAYLIRGCLGRSRVEQRI